MHNPLIGKSIWFSDLSTNPDTIDQCNCDCACSTVAGENSNSSSVAQILSELKETDKIRLNPELIIIPIVSHVATLSVSSNRLVILGEDIKKIIEYSGEIFTNKEIVNIFSKWNPKFVKQIIAILLDANIFLKDDNLKPVEFVSSQTLTVWLQLTNACTLKCAYCFVPQRKQNMSAETARRSINAIFRSAVLHGFKKVKIKFAGGEPSINFSVLKMAQEYAEFLSSHLNLEFESVILTSGVNLDNQQINYLCKHKIGIMVSLDGIDYFQDVHRKPVHANRGSYKQVEKTLFQLLGRGISPQITRILTLHFLA